jgi:hypothetical protein
MCNRSIYIFIFTRNEGFMYYILEERKNSNNTNKILNYETVKYIPFYIMNVIIKLNDNFNPRREFLKILQLCSFLHLIVIILRILLKLNSLNVIVIKVNYITQCSSKPLLIFMHSTI